MHGMTARLLATGVDLHMTCTVHMVACVTYHRRKQGMGVGAIVGAERQHGDVDVGSDE